MRFCIMRPEPTGILYLMGDLGLSHSFKLLDPERAPANGYLLSWPSAEEAEKVARKWLPSVEGVFIGAALVPSRDEQLSILRRKYDEAIERVFQRKVRGFIDLAGEEADALWLQILKLSIRLPGDP